MPKHALVVEGTTGGQHRLTGAGPGGQHRFFDASITDDFNRPDAATLAGPWYYAGTPWIITSNRAASSGAGGAPSGTLALLSGGASDGTVQVDIVTRGAAHGVGPAFRGTDPTIFGGPPDFWYVADTGLVKVVSGAGSIVLAWLYTAPCTIAVDLLGPSITVRNVTAGTVLGSISDSHAQTNTWHGMITAATDSRFDNFSFTP